MWQKSEQNFDKKVTVPVTHSTEYSLPVLEKYDLVMLYIHAMLIMHMFTGIYVQYLICINFVEIYSSVWINLNTCGDV